MPVIVRGKEPPFRSAPSPGPKKAAPDGRRLIRTRELRGGRLRRRPPADDAGTRSHPFSVSCPPGQLKRYSAGRGVARFGRGGPLLAASSVRGRIVLRDGLRRGLPLNRLSRLPRS